MRRPARTGRCVLLLIVLLGAPMGAAGQQLLPVDEAAMQPEFFTFRARLQRAIARRDVEALLAAVDPNIRTSFGPEGGIAAFRKMWKLDAKGGASDIWDELGSVLALGGVFNGEQTFVAPYTFARFPADLDAFEHVVVIGSDVRLRAQGRATAPVVGASSFGILRLDRGASTDGDWTRVRVDGRTAYVASHLVRSPIDYRAIFSSIGGSWRLVTFVAGD